MTTMTSKENAHPQIELCGSSWLLIQAIMLYRNNGFPFIPCLQLHSSMKAEPESGYSSIDSIYNTQYELIMRKSEVQSW